MPLKGGSQALPFDPLRVGERFLEQREGLGLSRAELAEMCGYKPEQVRRVERGQQTPGARLLAALAEAGGDVRGLLLGAGYEEEMDEMDAIMAAKRRDEWRRDARMWRQATLDRRKKLLSDDEADLIELYRELDRRKQTAVMDAVKKVATSASGPAGSSVFADRGSIAAGGNVTVHEPKPPRYRKK